MWQRAKGYVFLGLGLGLITPVIHGTGKTLVIALLLGVLFKGCYWLYRSDRALRQGCDAIRARKHPSELVAWQKERAANPIDRKYALGWFASIGLVALLLALLPAHLSGRMIAWAVLAEIAFIAVYVPRYSQSRARFFRSVAHYRIA